MRLLIIFGTFICTTVMAQEVSIIDNKVVVDTETGTYEYPLTPADLKNPEQLIEDILLDLRPSVKIENLDEQSGY